MLRGRIGKGGFEERINFREGINDIGRRKGGEGRGRQGNEREGGGGVNSEENGEKKR